MKAVDQRIAEAMLAAPDAASAVYPGGMAALRRAVGCDAAELKAAVQRMRWAGKISQSALMLTPSMFPPSPEASADKAAAKTKSRESATPGRSPGQAYAEAGLPLSAAKGVGADTTAVSAPAALRHGLSTSSVPAQDGRDQIETAATLPAAGAGAAPTAPVHPIAKAEAKRPAQSIGKAAPKRTAGGHQVRASAPEAGSVPPPPPPAPPVAAKAKPSWVERHLARRDAARAFLAGMGRHPYRTGIGASLKWQVPGWCGTHSDHDLIAIAQGYGFEQESEAAA